MKKHLLTLFIVVLAMAASAQTTHPSSESTSLSVKESDTWYTITSSFPAGRMERLKAQLSEVLGSPEQAGGEIRWSAPDNHYTAALAADRLSATLDKEKASGRELEQFKNLAEKLRQALNTPKTPKQP